jgi:hypothetical protein
VASVGLNPAFNWVSVFGYVYSDLGWFAPVYIGLTGILVGYLWKKFNEGRLFGVVLYPWMGFAILFWFGYNIMFSSRIIAIVEAGIVLMFWERLFVLRKRPSCPKLVSRDAVPNLQREHEDSVHKA